MSVGPGTTSCNLRLNDLHSDKATCPREWVGPGGELGVRVKPDSLPGSSESGELRKVDRHARHDASQLGGFA